MAKYEKSYARGQISSWTGALQGMAPHPRQRRGPEARRPLLRGIRRPAAVRPPAGLLRRGDAPRTGSHRHRAVRPSGHRQPLRQHAASGPREPDAERVPAGEHRDPHSGHLGAPGGPAGGTPARASCTGTPCTTSPTRTGGELHEDANDFGAELGDVLESSTVTYLLSFEPSEPGEPGEHHRIRVRARAPKGAQISHRMGYYTPPAVRRPAPAGEATSRLPT